MEYRILGPFEVLDGDEPVHLGGGRQRAFLALLLLSANQVVSIDRIVDQLWTTGAPETAGNVIQVYVSRLRKALEPERLKGSDSSVLLTRRPGYMLKVDPQQIDAARFEQLSRRGAEAMEEGSMGIAATLLRQSLDLWHGEVLADLTFEEFARADIDRLTEARLVCEERLVEARLALGGHESLVGELEALVQQHPLREQLWAHLMVALYRSGRQAEALRAYRRAADTLVEELGIDPSPVLQELEDRVLMHDPSLDAPAVRRNELQSDATQPPPPPLIGREAHIAALGDALQVLTNGRSVLVTIVGEAGMGVGRLMAECERLARRAEVPFRQARAFPTSTVHPNEVIDQLGPRPDGPQVISVVNAHDCDPTSLAALRARLVDDGPPALVVLGVTPGASRTRTAISELRAAVSPSCTTVDLRAGRLTIGDHQRIMDSDLAGYLMSITDGFPFETARALEHLRTMGSVDWRSGRIETIGALPEPMIVAGPAQRVKELPRPQRRLVEATALADIPLPLSAAARLLGLDEHEALDVIDELVATGFLDETPEGIAVAGQLRAGRLTEGFGETRRSALYSDLADVIGDEGPTAVTGWFALNGGRHAQAAEMLFEAGLEAVAHGHLAEAQPLLEGSISARRRLQQVGDHEWGRLHLGLAQCHRLAGWTELAHQALEEARPCLTGEELIDCLGWMAQVSDDRQRVAEGEWWVAAGEREALLAGNQTKLGSLLSLRARLLNRLAFAEESDRCGETATELLAAVPRSQRAFMDYNRAWIAFDRGEMRGAEAAFATLADHASSEGQLADVSAWHGRALFPMGRVGEAIAKLDRAVALGRKNGDSGPVFLAHLGRAEGALAFERLDEASSAVEEFTGLVLHQLPAWENLARLLAARTAALAGEWDRASHEVSNALELTPANPSGRRWWLLSRALQMRIDQFDGPKLDELAAEAKAARWGAAEAALYTWMADVRGDADLALETATAAFDRGLVMPALLAVDTAGSRDSEIGSAVMAAIRSGAGDWALPEPQPKR